MKKIAILAAVVLGIASIAAAQDHDKTKMKTHTPAHGTMMSSSHKPHHMDSKHHMTSHSHMSSHSHMMMSHHMMSKSKHHDTHHNMKDAHTPPPKKH